MNATRHVRTALSAAIALAVVLGWSVAVRADDLDKVDAFLARLGLVDLQISHLEQRVAGDLSAEKRVELGRRLADLYASRLLTVQKDADQYARLRERIDSLITEIPGANTSSLAVMLLQADFTRAEGFTRQWIIDPQNTAARQNAREILAAIAPQLDKYRQDLTAQAETLSDQVEQLPEGDVREAREKELWRLREVAGRATFYAGWANYYLGLLMSGPEPLTAAREAFRQFLDIEKDDKYEDLNADWLGLESVFRSRAVIGLGLVEAAGGRTDASRAIFKWLDSPAVPLDIRDQAPTWYLQGLLNAGRVAEARGYAEEQIDAFSDEPTQGKVSFCAAAVRAGFAREDATEDARQLGKLGIVKLARMQCFRAIRQLMDQCTVDLGDEDGFFLKWIQGRQLLKKAGETKSPADYQTAADQLNKALADPEARREASSAGQARSDLAECYYGLKELQSAATEFERAAGGLKASNRDAAALALWNAFVCHLKLAATQPSAVRSAARVGQEFKQDFPGHEDAKRIDFLIARLQRNAQASEEAVRRLSAIPPDSPNYLEARFDLCLVLHELWQKAKGGDRENYAVKVREAVETYMAAAKGDTEQTRKLKCLLLATETALLQNPPDVKLATSLLDRARLIADSLPKTSLAAANYYYFLLQLARITRNDVARRKCASWLLENAAGSVYELSALIARATAIDGEAKNATGGQLDDLNREGYEVYGRLAKRLGSSPEILKQNKNARVACSRLAEYAFRLGKYAEAADLLDRLLSVFPDNADYLPRAARSHFQAGNYEKSLNVCRELLQGLESGSADWYEAKYHQLSCLSKIDKQQARNVWKQFELLHPNMGGPEWREKFDRLGREINGGTR
jgi:tetratricopeptide (TPR) repeat protein